jgi:hypothetical protein
MNLGMLLLIGLAIVVAVVGMRLSWRLVNKISDEPVAGEERPTDDDE